MTTVFEVRLMVAKLEGGISGTISVMDIYEYPTQGLEEYLGLVKEIA